MSFASLVEDLPSSGAVVFGATRVGTDELVSLARRTAQDLRDRGIRPGDRVAGMLNNSLPYMSLWFATAIAGAEFVPVNTRLRGDTLRHILADSGSRLIVVDSDHLAEIEATRPPEAALVESGVWLEGARALRGIDPVGSDGGMMLYTSGTTGRPKGVRWTSETQARQARAYVRELVPLVPGDNSYSCLPLFHVTCTGVSIATLLAGATVHIDPRFSLSTFWSRIRETGAVFFPYVGAVLSLLVKDERPHGAHGVRFAMGAAAPLDMFQRFEERFGIRLLETYGQTELGSIWLANHAHVPGAVGRSCPRAEFRLVPVDGITHAAELQVRPIERANMMLEYHVNPEANQAAWVDGWYRTRDLATVDADGNFRYAGRLADCLRRRGENVSAYEVERAVLQHHDVVEAAVVGVDSELGEQDIALYYVERHPGTLDAAHLHQWCRQQLSNFMVPRYYRAVAEFPKTETQRVQKGILHDRVGLRGAYDAAKASGEP